MSHPPAALKGLSSVKLALLARQTRAQSMAVLCADPIAVIGLGCRVPGGGDTPERYWQILRDGVDTVSAVPRARWDSDAWYDADLAAAGKMAVREGGFLSQVDAFDAEYFGLMAREAERMDPQQRLFLEVAIEALDGAGLSREMLRGQRAGAFVASYHNDYTQLQYNDPDAIDARTLTGTLHSVLVNRLSHFLDLRGPSVSVDTACSSSLVAVHLACQSLRSGESDVALAGGVSLILTPDLMVSMSKVGFMAPDGRCKTFDARADGFGRGEGCGVVVLKRLSDAIADGDSVLAVIRGSAVNQDGHSTLLAAPHGPAQEALIREALSHAQLEPERIGFIEAHGTGTALGDPIEVEAIAATVGRHGAAPCYLGSAKANLGHLEAAAGVVGLIKVVLALRHQAIPPQVHFSNLNPHISLEGSRLKIPTTLTPWPAGSAPRCAGVSSFGVGGTNAHVVLEEAPLLPGGSPADGDGSRVLTLSAHGDAARRATAEAWLAFLETTEATLNDICFTASQRRSHLDWKLAVVGSSTEDLRARLAEYLAGTHSPAVFAGQRAATAPRIAFVFSGQGPQWFGMGRELLAEEPVFAAVMRECDVHVRKMAGWSLLDVLARPEEQSLLDQTAYAQPGLFALQVALAALWKSWGISPDGVVGHSIGELAALYVAGVLSLPDAIRIVVHRGAIMQEATGNGRMASIAASEAEAQVLIAQYGTRLSLGAINAPRSVVLSGEQPALEDALAALAHRGIHHRMLPVQYAFHSAQMAPFADRLANAVAGIEPTTPGLPIYSTVTGRAAVDVRFDEQYFGRNLREPVRFADAIAAMAADGYDAFIEIGPHPVLLANVEECVTAAGRSAMTTATLRRAKPERDAMLQACAAVYAAGRSVQWDAINSKSGAVVPLPSYPWQRKRFWLRDRPASAVQAGRDTRHPLLGRQLEVAGDRVRVWQGDSRAARPWLTDHRIYRRIVMPAAAVVEAFVAAAVASGFARVELTGLTIQRPLFVPEDDVTVARWQVVATFTDEGRLALELFDDVARSWRLVASATAAEYRPQPGAVGIPDAAQMSPVLPSDIYARFERLGVEFGPSFQRLNDVRGLDGAAVASIAPATDTTTASPFVMMHPGTLDGAFQLCSIAAGVAADVLPTRVFLPLAVDRITWQPGSTSQLSVAARRRPTSGSATLSFDASLTASGGVEIARLDGVHLVEAKASAFDPADESLYQVVWNRADALPASVGSPSFAGTWLMLADATGTADALVGRLVEGGAHVIQAVAGDQFQQTSRDRFVIDPRRDDDFRRLLEEIAGRISPVRGVLHLWSLDLSDRLAPEQADLWTSGSSLHLLQAALRGSGMDAPVWLISRGAYVVSGEERHDRLQPVASGLWGIANVAAAEHPELRVHTVDLDPDAEPTDVDGLIHELREEPTRRVSAHRAGYQWLPQLAQLRTARSGDDHPSQLRVARQGTLDGLALQPIGSKTLGVHDVRVRVCAAGVNFRDVLVTLNMYPGEAPPLGAECAGIVTDVGRGVRAFRVGDRVFGLATGSMATEVVTPEAFLTTLPANLPMEQAAALPVAFLTAHYGLHRLAGLRAGERVLIHAATGGVGMAALQIAKRAGAEVFATAGSPAKRAWLRGQGVAHVMDSRSLSFEGEIAAATNGAGVDVVLNSLAGDFIAASLRALGRGGRFLELGKRDILTLAQVRDLRPDVQYHAYDLGSEATAEPAIVRPMLDAILAGLVDHSLQPLPVTTFPLDRAHTAFRFMAHARHLGKIVLRGALDGALADARASYLITGGFGALGLETAAWLVRKGARHLVLTGRRPPSSEARSRIAALEREGSIVQCVLADIADAEQTRRMLDQIRAQLPPLKGIVHAAGSLHDGVLLNQRWEACREVMSGKAHGARVLDQLTRDLPLDFFILYSAAGALLGAAGQGLYPSANLELNSLAQARRAQGLRALSVGWGAWTGHGMAAPKDAAGTWEARGLQAITADTGFAQLERLLRADVGVGIVLPIDWSRFLNTLSDGVDRGFFAAVSAAGDPAPAARSKQSRAPLHEQLLQAPVSQRRPLMMAHVRECAVHVLGLDAAALVEERAPLKEAGLDSLMAVELRNTLVRSIGCSLPATLLFDYPTLDTLTAYLLRAAGFDQEPARVAVDDRTAVDRHGIAALSEEDAEAQLIAELERGGTHG
jgi:acyl transferase domain-containing protein/NADPH:quinone reductase-like Zn-dependent oxidoreductase/NAD(P)-dependent dehydrogenase (short-subunit alcohol dehydrogenase family)